MHKGVSLEEVGYFFIYPPNITDASRHHGGAASKRKS